MNVLCVAIRASYVTFFVFSKGKNDFERLLTIFAEEFVPRHEGTSWNIGEHSTPILSCWISAPRLVHASSSAQSCLDQAERFIGGDKDLVTILNSKTGYIKREMVLVRH